MLYPLSLVARHLRKDAREMTDLVENHGLPVISIPARTRPVRKVILSCYHRWLTELSENAAPTLNDLKRELEELDNPTKSAK